ncbi:MAG TPA: 4Fe-4S binding protein [Nitrospirota bacterium]|jgi:2-oxoglutarate ferredoxin oxidoreductase subunit delta
MVKAVLDRERCKGCYLCTTMCPKGIIVKAEGFNGFGFYTVEIQGEGCVACGMCALVCPDVAITMEDCE